jgi:hypothetical protein
MKHTPTSVRRILHRLAIGVAIAGVALASLRCASLGPVAGLVQIIAGASILAACIVAVLDEGPRRAFATGMALCGVACILMRLSGVPYFANGLGTHELNSWLQHRLTSDEWVDQLGHVFTEDPNAAPTATPSTTSSQTPANPGPLPPPPSPLIPPGSTAIPAQSQAVQGGSPSGLAAAAEWAEQQQKLSAVDRQVSDLKRVAKIVGEIEKLAGQIPPGTAIGTVTKRQVPNIDDFYATADSWWLLLIAYAGGLFARYVHTCRTDHKTT